MENLEGTHLYSGMRVLPFHNCRCAVQLLTNEEQTQITGATAFLTVFEDEVNLNNNFRGLKLILDRISMTNVYQAFEKIFESAKEKQYAYLINNNRVQGRAVDAIPLVNLTQKGVLVDEYPKNWRDLDIEPGNSYYDNYLYAWKRFEWVKHFTELWCEASLQYVTLERESASGKSYVVSAEWKEFSFNIDDIRIA